MIRIVYKSVFVNIVDLKGIAFYLQESWQRTLKQSPEDYSSISEWIPQITIQDYKIWKAKQKRMWNNLERDLHFVSKIFSG